MTKLRPSTPLFTNHRIADQSNVMVERIVDGQNFGLLLLRKEKISGNYETIFELGNGKTGRVTVVIT